MHAKQSRIYDPTDAMHCTALAELRAAAASAVSLFLSLFLTWARANPPYGCASAVQRRGGTAALCLQIGDGAMCLCVSIIYSLVRKEFLVYRFLLRIIYFKHYILNYCLIT